MGLSAGWAMRSFCDACGALRGTLPFGTASSFFDRNWGPCRCCGEPGPGLQVICRHAGHWWSRRRPWIDRDGNEVPRV